MATAITIRYNSDVLVSSPEDWDGTDRAASVAAYEESLARELTALYGGPVSIVDDPSLMLNQSTVIEINPCPDDPRELQAQIQADMEAHWARGEFWVVAQ